MDAVLCHAAEMTKHAVDKVVDLGTPFLVLHLEVCHQFMHVTSLGMHLPGKLSQSHSRAQQQIKMSN